MSSIESLLEKNRAWAAAMREEDPAFFQNLAHQQQPDYLWIGCADSRVPATQLVGLPPGEMFVHRNVANLVVHTDFNCLSVLQFAVEVLQVSDVIVCGHYGCGGVHAALLNRRMGLIDNWLRHVHDVRIRHSAELEGLAGDEQRFRRLCELNVIEQVVNVSQTTIVQQARGRGQQLKIHGWIYSVEDGLVQPLPISNASDDELHRQYQQAVGLPLTPFASSVLG
ncbi:MAG TPA: carbonate dehydratase [Herpetosiphonaceae bacterium]